MTLSELVETCGHIGLITATVRGTKHSEYERASEYRIGSRAEYYPGDYRRAGEPDPTVHIIQKPVHVRDAGASSCEFGQVMKNIPIKLLKMQVTYWTCGTEYVDRAFWTCGERPYHLRCDLLSPEAKR